MVRTKLSLRNVQQSSFLTLAAVAFIVLACFPARAKAQQQGQKTFPSADAASEALVTAVKNNDDAALLEIWGPGAKEIISSGDLSEDKENRANFAKKYDEMHRLVKEPDGTTTLYIGAENWPSPIPLVNAGSVWYFDTEAGKKEVLYRRVGHNEMSAIRVCEELVAAENEHFAQEHDEYAQKFASDEGKHNGLYWVSADKKSESPIGPLVADAGRQVGEAKTLHTGPAPFRGYYFRILTRQGKNAKGGAANYLVDGKMAGGFAFVAYPAEYRNSGIMTFIVNKDGVVYQKDLGRKTESAATSMKQYDPDSSWQTAQEEDEQTANEQKIQ